MTALLAIAGWSVALAAVGALRRRAALLADAQHELRGPLTALSLGLQGLCRQAVSRGRAQALLVELDRMEAAVADVGAAGRGRRATARPSPVRLDRLVARSGEAWSAAAAAEGRRVLVDWQGGRAPSDADPRRLAQAFGNLLANAVEHGDGDVIVRGRRGGERVRIEIENAGRGRGLAIAERGLAQAGGRLSTMVSGDRHLAVAELPVSADA